VTLLDVKQGSEFTVICPDVPLSEKVDVYKATTSVKAEVVSVGDYVTYMDDGAAEVMNKLA